MEIQYKLVSTAAEIQQMLALQAVNHVAGISAEVAAEQGFVTVRHDFEVLKKMNDAAPASIAILGGEVVGYCLAMPPEFRTAVPVLEPMFAMLEKLEWKNRPIAEWRWFVMGQVCVAAKVRGQGVFDRMYEQLAEAYRSDFQLIITEIATRNLRSLRAHRRVGFEIFHTYSEDLTGESWEVVAWEIG